MGPWRGGISIAVPHLAAGFNFPFCQKLKIKINLKKPPSIAKVTKGPTNSCQLRTKTPKAWAAKLILPIYLQHQCHPPPKAFLNNPSHQLRFIISQCKVTTTTHPQSHQHFNICLDLIWNLQQPEYLQHLQCPLFSTIGADGSINFF